MDQDSNLCHQRTHEEAGGTSSQTSDEHAAQNTECIPTCPVQTLGGPSPETVRSPRVAEAKGHVRAALEGRGGHAVANCRVPGVPHVDVILAA